jgi:hypothetical protein
MTAPLDPDHDQIERWFATLFRHAGQQGYVSLRAFTHDNKPLVPKMWNVRLSNGLHPVIQRAFNLASRAANHFTPAVFCPPPAVFDGPEGRAREQDLLLGLVISVECDEHPEDGRRKIEEVFGEATMIVKSGGQWINGNNEPEDKLHLFWRLAVPASGPANLEKLKRARKLATQIAGGDTSNVPTVHCLRAAGSWHRKAAPRLCVIAQENPDREIELDDALRALEAAPGAGPGAGPGVAGASGQKQRGTGTGAGTAGGKWSSYLTNLDDHDNNTAFAEALIASGMHPGAAYNLMRQGIEALTGIDEARRQRRLFELSGQIDSAVRKIGTRQQEPESGLPPPYDIDPWDLTDPPPLEWAVQDLIPLKQVALFSGEGAAGKSTMGLHLCAAVTLGQTWLNYFPAPGPARRRRHQHHLATPRRNQNSLRRQHHRDEKKRPPYLAAGRKRRLDRRR